MMQGLESFKKSKQKAEQVILGELHLNIISYNDLVTNKLAVNRKIDQSDIREMNKLRKNR